MTTARLPRSTKRQLVVLLAVGGCVGAAAAALDDRRLQLACVALAVFLGVVAGVRVHRARRPRV